MHDFDVTAATVSGGFIVAVFLLQAGSISLLRFRREEASAETYLGRLLWYVTATVELSLAFSAVIWISLVQGADWNAGTIVAVVRWATTPLIILFAFLFFRGIARRKQASADAMLATFRMLLLLLKCLVTEE